MLVYQRVIEDSNRMPSKLQQKLLNYHRCLLPNKWGRGLGFGVCPCQLAYPKMVEFLLQRGSIWKLFLLKWKQQQCLKKNAYLSWNRVSSCNSFFSKNKRSILFSKHHLHKLSGQVGEVVKQPSVRSALKFAPVHPHSRLIPESCDRIAVGKIAWISKFSYFANGFCWKWDFGMDSHKQAG